jgi:geranylgeranyl reductase family protein
VERFDVAVVGAGPAGSVTAIHLARAGARVLLLDKATFPRDKPCGGGLTLRAVRALPVDPGPVVERVVSTLEFRLPSGARLARPDDGPLIQMTQRRRLDAFLVEQAVAAGAEFEDGVRIVDLDESGIDLVRRRIAVGAIVGADGANGISARKLGLQTKMRHGVAYEGNIAYENGNVEAYASTAVLHLAFVSGGYGWIFPKGDHLNVGVGGWASEAGGLRMRLLELCELHGLDAGALDGLRGYRLPMRYEKAVLACGRGLLVGDAAGLVDPFSGDGMYEAFRSARLAATAVLELLAGKRQSLVGYSAEVARALDPMTAVAWMAKRVVDRVPQVPFARPWRTPVYRLIGSFVRGDVFADDEPTTLARVFGTVGRHVAGQNWKIA